MTNPFEAVIRTFYQMTSDKSLRNENLILVKYGALNCTSKLHFQFLTSPPPRPPCNQPDLWTLIFKVSIFCRDIYF